MQVTINWNTRVISVAKSELTLIQPFPEIREMNLNDFRMALKDQEDSEQGMCFPDTHKHNTEVSLGGLTFARVVEIINGYTVTFEDGQYAVNLVGANSNISDKVNVNQVSVRSANSAGLQTVVSGSGVTEQDKIDIAGKVLDELVASHTIPNSLANVLALTNTNASLAASEASSASLAATNAELAAGSAEDTVLTRSVPGDAMSLTEAERSKIAEAICTAKPREYNIPDSLAAYLTDLTDSMLGRWSLNVQERILTLYRRDGSVLKYFRLTPSLTPIPAFSDRIPV